MVGGAKQEHTLPAPGRSAQVQAKTMVAQGQALQLQQPPRAGGMELTHTWVGSMCA